MSEKPSYPKREPEQFFALKFIRFLFDTEVAMQLGQEAMLLLVHIAQYEDRLGYRPVGFWNTQLSKQLGFKTEDALARARAKCVAAGFLHYEPGNRHTSGIYWVTIPGGSDKVQTDTGEQFYPRKNAEADAGRTRARPEADAGQTGGLLPLPKPKPKKKAAVADPPSESDQSLPGAGRPRDLLFEAIAEVLCLDWTIQANKGQIVRMKDVLSKAKPPYTPAEVLKAGEIHREVNSWKKGPYTPPKPGELSALVSRVRMPHGEDRGGSIDDKGGRPVVEIFPSAEEADELFGDLLAS